MVRHIFFPVLLIFSVVISLSHQAFAAEKKAGKIEFYLERELKDGKGVVSRIPKGAEATIGMEDGIPVIGLEYIDQSPMTNYAEKEPEPLVRELVRQAFLFSAREYLGWRTRDVLLGEPLPANPLKRIGRVGIVSAIYQPGGSRFKHVIGVAIFQENEQGRKFLFNKSYPIKGEKRDVLSQFVRVMSFAARDEFPAVLRKLGLPELPQKKATKEKLPDDFIDNQFEMNCFTQYRIIQGLHQWINEKGPNWQAYFQLAQAYGHLGVLTELLWNDMSTIFKARGFLYTIRATQSAKKGGTEKERLQFLNSLGGRPFPKKAVPKSIVLFAYLQAIYGRHADAFDTIELYKKVVKQGDWSTATNVDTQLYYANAIANYDLKALEDPQGIEAKHLGAFYHFTLLECSGQKVLLVELFKKAIFRNPNCLRICEAMALGQTVGTMRIAMDSLVRGTPLVLRKKLPEFESISDDLDDTLENYQQQIPEVGEIASRESLIEKLREIGAKEETNAEFTSSILAQLILERTFVAAEVAVDMHTRYWGINADPVIDRYESICQSHPFNVLLMVRRKDKSKMIEAFTKYGREVSTHPAPAFRHNSMQSISRIVNQNFVKKGISFLSSRFENTDYTYSSLLACWRAYHLSGLSVDLSPLIIISPKSELGQLSRITDRKVKKEEILAIENEFQDSLIVLTEVSKWYSRKNLLQDNMRVLERLVNLTEDDSIYNRLAYAYSRQGLEEKWVEIIKKMLELPTQSLSTVHWEVQLAYWYSRANKKEKAIEHAKHAYQARSAESYSALIAIYTKFGDYEKADKIYEAMADHYKNQAPAWLRWSLCHNKGDTQKAKQTVEKYFESLGVPAPDAHLESIFSYYVIINEPKKAYVVMKAFPDYKKIHPANLLIGACVADQLGKKKDRDQLIQVLIDLENDKRRSQGLAAWIAYAKRLKQFLEKPNKSLLSLNFVNKTLGNTSNDVYQNVYLTSAYFLAVNGDQKEANQFLHLASLLLNDFPINANIIAREILRKQGLTIGPANKGISTEGL